MNRLAEYLDDPLEPEPPCDFFEIGSYCGTFVVTESTALAVERSLLQQPPPRWVVFRDLDGSRHRVLVRLIYRISENTAAQRAANRAFSRARRLEEKKDRRPWEEDDC
jgi:hypothetical protein